MPAAPHRRDRWRASAKAALNLALFGLALWALDRLQRAYPMHDVGHALTAIPWLFVLLAAVISAVAYVPLIGYDLVAFRITGHKFSWRQALVPSFVSFAVSNNAPASVATAGGVRYKMYRPYGLTVGGAVHVAGVNVVTYVVGLCALAGVALLLRPTQGAASGLHLSGQVLGGILLVLVAAYFAACLLVRGPVRVRGRELRFPTGRLALAQLGVSVADWLLSSAPLYLLLSTFTAIPYLTFLTTFLLGACAALLLPIPGGIGVFEAVILLLRPTGAPGPQTLAALLLYRVVYYLLPLFVAGVILAARMIRDVLNTGHPWREMGERLAALTPRIVALITFLSGVVLLVTGAIPADDTRLAWLATVLPLGVIEASYFLSSIVGAVLVVLAWGLERRVRFAYRVVRLLFGVGILLTLSRSFDLRLAAFLTIVLTILYLAGRQFPEDKSLVHEPMTSRWIFAVGATVCLDIWVALLTYTNVRFAGETWWQFALSGPGPRALRTALGATVVTLLFALARLLSGIASEHKGH